DRLSRLSPGERARLSWEIENKLVDEVLGESYAEWLDFQQAGSAAAALAKAVFTGSRNAAAVAVRDNDSVDVSLHTCPESYRGRLRSFPTVQVSVGRLRAFVKEHPGSVWALQDENADHRLERPVLVREPGEIQFGRRYFVSSHTCYSGEVGLVFQGPGENWEPHVSGERRQLIRTGPHLETLEEHLLRSLEYFRRLVRIQEGYALQRLAGSTGLAQDDVERLVTMALISHDLGKATREWQKAAWDTVELWLEEDPRHEELLTPEEHCLLSQDRSQTFLARFPSLSDPFREPRRPPHATVSAYAVWELFVRLWDGLGEAAALAVAHHHSVRAAEVPRYQLKPEWLEHFAGLLRTEAGIEVRREDFIEARRSTTELEPRMPPFHREIQYTVYLVVSRCLSLSDRMAAGGGEDAILDFEKWTGSL
ncbi:MAG: CRISPR-associated endonuclease Cas3'', partial [Desulfotomaculales bacterium]